MLRSTVKRALAGRRHGSRLVAAWSGITSRLHEKCDALLGRHRGVEHQRGDGDRDQDDGQSPQWDGAMILLTLRIFRRHSCEDRSVAIHGCLLMSDRMTSIARYPNSPAFAILDL